MKIELVTITIPVIVDELDEHTGPRIITKLQTRFLSKAQRHGIHRASQALQQMGERYGSDSNFEGKEVANNADGIRWILEQIEARTKELRNGHASAKKEAGAKDSHQGRTYRRKDASGVGERQG